MNRKTTPPVHNRANVRFGSEAALHDFTTRMAAIKRKAVKNLLHLLEEGLPETSKK